MGRSPNVAPPFLMESENPDRKIFSPQDDMYQDIDTQEYGNWICGRDSPPIDPELEQMDEENVEDNESDPAYYNEPNHNTKDGNGDSEKEDDTNTLPSVSSLLEKAQRLWSAVNTSRNLFSSQKNGIYISDFILWLHRPRARGVVMTTSMLLSW